MNSPHRSSALAKVALSEFVLTSEPNQRNSDVCLTSAAGLTLLSDRKRQRSDDEDSDIDDCRMSKISMKPDILTFYRTPGAFKFCRRTSNGPAIDYFHSSNRGSPLPENVVIEILSFLNKRDLCNAMASCRLLYSAGSHCKTWEYMDLFNRTVFHHSLIGFLNRRLKVLRMADTNALSMEGQDLRLDAGAICSAIGQNCGLIRLDLSMTLGIDAAAVRSICQGCTKIQDLNLSWSSLDQEAIITICSNLPDTVTRLNLAGSLNKSSLNDEAVERLVTNCRNLKELDLSDNINITERGLQIINCLPQLESLSLNRCFGIPPTKFLCLTFLGYALLKPLLGLISTSRCCRKRRFVVSLEEIDKSLILACRTCGYLTALNVFGCITEAGLAALKNGLVETEVNQSVFNYIAKPTVPPAVTSIWGQRTKDFY